MKNNKKKNILIFPCGSEIGLEIHRALSDDIHFELYGASSQPDHGKFVYKNYIEGIPFVNKDNFIEEINKICKDFCIDFIIPAHDSVVLKLAENKDNLCAKLITSSVETCRIARSKSQTYKILKDVVPVPSTYNITDSNIAFPVFVKPDVGQGSKGAKKINNIDELNMAYTENNSIIISEFLPGKEYTVDCFTNCKGELLFAKGRTRTRIMNGISVNSKPVDNPMLYELAKRINTKISFCGVWFFQVKERKNGELVLMEFAPRIAGTMGLYRGLGINFILLSLYDAMGFDVNIIENSFDIEIDRALFARYNININYDYVYIDFDDTILTSGKLNTDVIKYLYQCQNENKKIILITKHSNDIYKTLAKYHICKNLFCEIITLSTEQHKADYIKYKNSIFIDDSYAEREKIIKTCNIPVFSIDAIEVLINYKK